MDVTIGQLLDKKYRIVRLLGEGGMGAVYEGENIRVHNRVAIKVLHAGIATNQAAVDRFEREAQAAGRIGSDHIVEVYDLGDLPSGARYMVMEFLDGESLSARVARVGRIAPGDLAGLMMQLMEGLGAAHKAGIIHRDLKPDNVFLTKTKQGHDFVKLVDFGVSKFNQLSGDSAMSMTRTGAVIGTPYYMSPEQAKGSKDIDHRADLYSAGVVMFECVTGQVPFLADTFNELMFKIVLEPQPDPEKVVPGLDPGFAAIIKKGMARDAKDRYQSAEEFAQAISAWMGATMGVPMSMPRHPSSPDFAAASVPGSVPNLPAARAGSNPNIATAPGAQAVTANDQLGGTANPLASSTVKAGPPNKGAAMAVVGVAAVLLIGGVAAFALKSSGKSAAASDPPAASASAATSPPTPSETAATATAAPSATAATTATPVADAGDTALANTTTPSPDTAKTEKTSAKTDKTEKAVAATKSGAASNPGSAGTHKATTTTTPAPPPAGTKPDTTKTGGKIDGRGYDQSL